MSEKVFVSEENEDVWKEWFKEARKQTLETLPEFIRHMMEDYRFDYGTAVHAIAACSVGAAWAGAEAEGITGFQAGCVMWDFVRYWNHSTNKCGMKLVDYDKMLYPQYEETYEKVLSKDTWEAIQNRAKELLNETLKGILCGDGTREHPIDKHEIHPDVIDHWKSIVDGKVPFGYTVSENLW